MPKADVNLAHAMTLKPEEAIRYFESKGYTLGFNWHDVEARAHATVIGREIFKRETCDKCGSTWDKLDLSGTGQCNYFSVCERENRIKITCHCIFPQR